MSYKPTFCGPLGGSGRNYAIGCDLGQPGGDKSAIVWSVPEEDGTVRIVARLVTEDVELARFLATAPGRLREAEALLRRVEWISDRDDTTCPECRMAKVHGHATDCALRAWLDGSGG